MMVVSKSKEFKRSLKFADSCIEMAVDMMLKKGCSKSRLEAKIAGGASMFSFGDADMKIGARNVEAVKRKLKELRIPLLSDDTGGNYGRTIEFDIASGELLVKSAFKGCKVI